METPKRIQLVSLANDRRLAPRTMRHQAFRDPSVIRDVHRRITQGGHSVYEEAARLGCSHTTVRTEIQKAGLTLERSWKRKGTVRSRLRARLGGSDT